MKLLRALLIDERARRKQTTVVLSLICLLSSLSAAQQLHVDKKTHQNDKLPANDVWMNIKNISLFNQVPSGTFFILFSLSETDISSIYKRIKTTMHKHEHHYTETVSNVRTTYGWVG